MQRPGARSRGESFAPPHQGTAGVSVKSDEAITRGRGARRWKLTVTCFGVTFTVAGMLMRSRKICRACALW